MNGNGIEILIIIFILGGIGMVLWVTWKGGAANPVGTGGLDDRQKAFDHELSGMRSQIDQIEERVEKMEGHYAKASDIKRIERRQEALDDKLDAVIKDISAIREEAAERGALAKATAKQLDLIYKIVVEKGMNS